MDQDKSRRGGNLLNVDSHLTSNMALQRGAQYSMSDVALTQRY